MTSFRVPREDQQKVLLFGIVFSLIARTGFIFLGAALINSFAWVFYLFGLILLLTAGNMLKPEGEESPLRATTSSSGWPARCSTPPTTTTATSCSPCTNGKRAMTPMLLVMVAIGGTDILFALDSIPAIFGLTQNTFIVFTATAFSLLGLRQLFFLIDGLLDRLIYLSYGLAAILAFIGVKLILHALHENNVPFINDGEPVPVVEISTGLSLSVILGVLVVTVVASLLSPAGKAQNAIANARRHATSLPGLGVHRRPGRARAHLPAAARRARPDRRPRPEVQAEGPRRTRPDGAARTRPRQPRRRGRPEVRRHRPGRRRSSRHAREAMTCTSLQGRQTGRRRAQ